MASREPPDCLACSAISSSSDSGPGLMVVSSDGGRLVPESRRLRCRRPKLSSNPRLEIAPPEAPFIPVPDRRQDARQRDTPQARISQEALHDLLTGNQIVFFRHSHLAIGAPRRPRCDAGTFTTGCSATPGSRTNARSHCQVEQGRTERVDRKAETVSVSLD